MLITETRWRSFGLWLVGGFAAICAAIFIFILIVDPYGVSPIAPAGIRPMLDTNQRFMYPQLIRAHEHDSLVIGTSTSRLLEPERLGAAFGGKFANLALSDGRAWEQYRIADLFIRENGAPKTLFVGIDRVWCESDADTARITKRGFPEWMYDDNRLNDLSGMFNLRTVVIAVRRIGMIFGLEKPRFDRNGFEDFTPGEAAYDAARAQEHIWGSNRRQIAPLVPAVMPTENEKAQWHVPALAWLEDLLQRVEGRSRVYLVFMPVHIAMQPQPGSLPDARERDCKTRIAALATQYGAAYRDFRVWSKVTMDDTNYWDPLHWRLPLGREVIQAVASSSQSSLDALSSSGVSPSSP